MPARVQAAFLESLLGQPRVTQAAVAERLGVDRSYVSRCLSGQRILGIEDSLYLVERFGPRPLRQAGDVLGLDIQVVEDSLPDVGADTQAMLLELLASLSGEVARLAEDLRSPRNPGHAQRVALMRRLGAVETQCRAAQRMLAAEPANVGGTR